MKDWLTIVLTMIGLIAFLAGVILAMQYFPPRLAAGSDAAPRLLTLENFESYPAGVFPDKWRMAKSDARKIYRIESESGNRFLRAHSEKQAIQIGLEHIFDPKQQQQLSWRWRAREFPSGADERRSDKHDTAAQVYVIFDNQILPRMIKYMWSAVVPTGSRFVHPLYSRARVVIVRSGAVDPTQWVDENINFYEDYKKFFNAEPGKVQGIAVMSSSDSTKSVAGADYDDFILLP